jgi:hypothetical protein
MKVEDSGNRSRVGGARLNAYSEARGRILWLGFMSKGILESNLDLGIFRDLFGEGSGFRRKMK